MAGGPWLPGLALVALACVSRSSGGLVELGLRRPLADPQPAPLGRDARAFGRNDVGEAGGAGHFYRPIWRLWNLGIFKLAGASAVAFRLGNLVLYAAVVLEVWALAARLADPRRTWIAAAVFAVYPRHGESVAWVSGTHLNVRNERAGTVSFGGLAVDVRPTPSHPAARLVYYDGRDLRACC